MSKSKKAGKQNSEAVLATPALSGELAADIRGLIEAARLR
jgi:hypothetical protein